MNKKYEFNRWKGREDNSWPYRVFKQHNQQLSRIYLSQISANKFTYSKLKESGAVWESSPEDFFTYDDPTHKHTFKDISGWSDAYNEFDNWVNLNSIMAMSSNLETYMATIIKLAIESDIGVIYGASKKIDGIKILKHNNAKKIDLKQHVMSCTKGDWTSRANGYEKIFGSVPDTITDYISDLEKIRKLRNNVGHAFGRDIDVSREHDVLEIRPMDKLSRSKTLYYQSLLFGVAKAIDKHLYFEHIGEFQTLYYYHQFLKTLPDTSHNAMHSNRVTFFRKALGKYGSPKNLNKKTCSDIIRYYDSL
ncbi:TPA: hypothetical protein ACVU4T_004977 [Vibrio parahaemolyticus]